LDIPEYDLDELDPELQEDTEGELAKGPPKRAEKKALREGEMKWPTKCGFNINKFSRTEEIYNLLLTYMLHENTVAKTELHNMETYR